MKKERVMSFSVLEFGNEKLWEFLKKDGWLRNNELTLVSAEVNAGIEKYPVTDYLKLENKFWDSFSSCFDDEILDELWEEAYKAVMNRYFGSFATFQHYEGNTRYVTVFAHKNGSASLKWWDHKPTKTEIEKTKKFDKNYSYVGIGDATEFEKE